MIDELLIYSLTPRTMLAPLPPLNPVTNLITPLGLLNPTRPHRSSLLLPTNSNHSSNPTSPLKLSTACQFQQDRWAWE